VNQDYGFWKAVHLSRFAILQILAKQIIVVPHRGIIDANLNSPFVYVCTFVQGLSTSGNGEGGSEQIREGAQISKKPLTAVFVYVRV